VRFEFMLGVARRLGLGRIATGHYARLTGEPPGLTRGVDRNKDQSYMLAEVAPDLLRQVVFPLGPLTKVEVRRLAAEAGLEGWSAPESQEICFVPDDDHRGFLRERLGDRPGAIVDTAGRELARHAGTYNFTIGQRKGLGIAGASASYVLALDAGRREVVVGDEASAAVGKLRIADVVRHRPAAGGRLAVQVRSSGRTTPGRLVDPQRIVLEQPVLGVAPGQTAVLYEGEDVVLAGTIQSTEEWTAGRPERVETAGK
jgi:tRNA-specific 2-thiouridylase